MTDVRPPVAASPDAEPDSPATVVTAPTGTVPQPAEPAAELPAADRRATNFIVLHYFVTNFGYFGVLSTLVVSLNAAGFDAGRIAVLVMMFSLTSKVAKIPLAPALDRFTPMTSVLIGCLMAGAGFALLRFSSGLGLTAGCLALAGIGISINNLASKQLAAAASDLTGRRARLFSIINVGVNIASGVAAPVALLLVSRGEHGIVLLGVGGCYCLAGVVTYLNFSRLSIERHAARASSWRTYVEVLTLRGMAPFLLVNFFGYVLYGQLFNVLALHVSRTLGMAGRLGWLYTLNALLIVLAQLAITRLAARWNRGRQAFTMLFGYAVWCVAFLLAYLLTGYVGAVVFTVVFTIAEMLFIPSIDVILLDLIGLRSRAVGYSVLSISSALGEAIGAGSGVASYRWLTNHGLGREFWLIGAGVALAFAVISYLLRTSMSAEPGRSEPAAA
jgi:MFS family permease